MVVKPEDIVHEIKNSKQNFTDGAQMFPMVSCQLVISQPLVFTCEAHGSCALPSKITKTEKHCEI